jgi:plastocyanin
MTARLKRNIVGVSTLAAAAVVVALASVLVAVSYSADPRASYRVELVAECMAFRLAGTAAGSGTADNPVLRLRAGQQVEIVLRGADAGMRHDLTIPDFDLKTPLVSLGETAVLRFRARRPGTYEYFCTMHPQVMRGVIVVDP